MKLDTTYMRYLTGDDWRVLQAVEKGSYNHEVVPTKLIGQLAHLKSGVGNTNKAIADLAKINLISRLRNASYDGYRLTYNGFDYVALKTLHVHGGIEELEHTIGVGKESDIYSCRTKQGEQRVLKIHRLGRVSFRSVRNKRDYLQIGKGGSWMYLSKLAAQKEYEFMRALHGAGFDVPTPYDCSRHLVLMERIEGFPMRQLYDHHDYRGLYCGLMRFAVRLACEGLIHCDYNEYNIMVVERPGHGDHWDHGDHSAAPDAPAKPPRDFVVIDFPQCISIEHPDAEFYFSRDVACIRRFFKRRFGYTPARDDPAMLDTDGFGDGFRYGYPVFDRDVNRRGDLDVQVKASGYRRRLDAEDVDLQGLGSFARGSDEPAWDSDADDDAETDSDGDGDQWDSDDHSDDHSDHASPDDCHDDDNEKIIQALSTGVGNLHMDRLGNYVLRDE